MNLAAILYGVARAMPAAKAVTAGGQTQTYAQFTDRAARIGAALRRRGLAPGERVAIFMENSAGFLEAVFGCWMAGLCAVPINAKLHAKEVAFVLENCGARLLVTSPTLAAEVAGLAETVVAGEDSWAALLRADPMAPHEARPDDPAWLFYTSGTTGRPKGATLSHRNMLFSCQAYYADIDFVDARDHFLHAAPLSHGSGLYGLAHMLKGGHQLVLKGFEPAEVLDIIARHQRLSFFAAPTMLTRLVTAAEATAPDTANLRCIAYGGGPMYVADLKRALQLFGPKLYQLYGQGESPMTITGLSKRAHVGANDTLLASCGGARTGVAVRVVDGQDRDLPPGEVGEVITRSDCVMLGYWGNQAATAETLRGGWLHTGDLGSLDAAGVLTLRDRSKDLIISGGSNIYPREVEEVVLRHPAVAECSVVGRAHADWGEEVVAFVVLRAGLAATEAELDALCLANIARFKRPKQWRFVEALPKNNYGKVLKTALRQMP